jgi:hypothetical protein
MGLFWFAAALLGAALIFAGCETEAETETKYVSGEMIYLDIEVDDEDGLREALAVEGDLAIGFTGTSETLTEALTIPDGKLVYILNGATLATDTGGLNLTVDGIVYVGIGGTLDVSAGNVIVGEGGSVSVLPVKSAAAITTGVPPGTLKVATALSVNDGEATAKTVLGTDKVWIGGALAIGGTFTDVAALATPFKYVGNGGTLDISVATVTGSTPSTLVAAIPQGKNLKATAAGAEAAATTTLVIPKGSDITALAGDTLATLTTLTVNGTFTTDVGTLEAVTALTVNGSLTAAASNITALGDSSVGAGGELTLLGATIAATKTLTVSGTLNVTGTLTVKGTLNATAGSIVVGTTASTTLAKASVTGDATTGAVLDGSNGSVTLAATDKIELADTGVITIVGSGSIVAGATTFSGAGTWTASIAGTAGAAFVGITSATTGATIAFDANSAGSATGGTLTAGGTAPTITQAADASNNLTIGANTTIDLGGLNTVVGTLTLTGDAANPGKITLAAINTSIVKTGQTAGDNPFSGATKIGGKVFGTSSDADITTATDGAAGKFAKLTAPTADAFLLGGGASNDITITGDAAVAS